MTAPLLEVVDLHKTFQLARQSWFKPHPLRRAVDGVSFVVQAGRSFGVVGESGSGKTTLARAVMALAKPTSGAVRLEGHSLFDISPAKLKALRAHFQMIFQDPYGSLDPRQTVERIVAEPLANLERVERAERRRRVIETLAEVGLDAAAAKKYPHEFSGGQRQRIAIARALITRPKLVVADEPVSALDVSIQAQVLNLMGDLQREAGVTYLADQPRSRGGRPHLRRDRGDVSWPHRRAGAFGGPAEAPCAPLYARARRRRAEARGGAARACRAAAAAGGDDRLRLRRPLSSR